VSTEIVLVSHPSQQWPGARDLRTAADGWLLCVTRNPLRDAAMRLLEEGHSPKSVLVIKDCFDLEPEQRSTIAEAAKR